MLRNSSSQAFLRPLLLACIALTALLRTVDVRSEEFATQVWVNPGFYSQHFKSGGAFRSNNIGIGAEVAFAPDHAIMAGSFINSDGRRSEYGAYWWRPLHWKISEVGVGAGIVAAALNGYPNYKNGDWFVAPIPALSVEGGRFGANVMIVPTIKNRVQGALAVQIKLRVW